MLELEAAVVVVETQNSNNDGNRREDFDDRELLRHDAGCIKM